MCRPFPSDCILDPMDRCRSRGVDSKLVSPRRAESLSAPPGKFEDGSNGSRKLARNTTEAEVSQGLIKFKIQPAELGPPSSFLILPCCLLIFLLRDFPLVRHG
ncbi:Hexosyltransferase [Psidium guajava]|nr:Hexosyltransferase [Psidium guajava]